MSAPKPPRKSTLTTGVHVPKSLTAARLGIGRTGGSLTTREILDFDLAHARARDAVHQVWDLDRFRRDIQAPDCGSNVSPTLMQLRSAAPDRPTYLKRPDMGRRLAADSAVTLADCPKHAELVIIVSDGLSAYAAAHQAPLVLRRLLPELQSRRVSMAPLLAIPLARVAVSDHVGEILKPRAALILIGERPGLATPESLGVYFTFDPRLGRTDAERNCISNIHADGLSPASAVDQILALVEASFRHNAGGVCLSVKMAVESENAGLDPPGRYERGGDDSPPTN